MKVLRNLLFAIGSLGIFTGFVYAVQPATLELVTSENEIPKDGVIDWGDFRPAPGSMSVQGLAGYSVTVSEKATPSFMQTFGQCSVSPGPGGCIQGSFAPGERVLSTGFGPKGPITFSFSSPIAQLGMQIQGGWYGTFVANLTAYDANNLLLGTVSRSGLSADRADDSAPFIGMKSNQVNISRVVIDVEPYSNFGHYFFISSPSVSLQVPEPTALCLIALFCIAAVSSRRHARKPHAR
jgi:hypothetical protein